MAQLLAPTAPDPGRISQILPTVKCSNCNQPVAIAELGDHVCAPPPSPSTSKPPPSPTTTASLLPQKFQNLVSSPRSQTPQARNDPPQPVVRQTSPLNPQRQNSPAPSLQSRARAPSTASSLSTRSGDSRSDHVPSPLGRSGTPDSSRLPFPSTPSHADPRLSTASHSSRASSRPDVSSLISRESAAFRAPTPARSNTPAPNTPAPRPRAPSTASLRPPPSLQPARQPAQSSPSPFLRSPSAGPSIPSQLHEQPRPRAASNVSYPAPPGSPDIIYSTTDHRGGPPMSAPPMRARAPSTASYNPPAAKRPSMMSTMSFSPPASAPPDNIDTKIGGEAGMAGVGRRGFAAAARAAMVASTISHVGTEHPTWSSMVPVQGMDGRRANAPTFLDIGSATNYSSVNTPPLSPNSGTPSPLSPHSPYSQKSPTSNTPRSVSGPQTPSGALPAIPVSTPLLASFPVSIGETSAQDRPLVPPQDLSMPPTPTTPSASSVRLPFFEKFKNKLPPVDTSKELEPQEDDILLSPRSPMSSGSESSYEGLAYANSDDEEEDTKNPTLPPAGPSTTDTNLVRFPSVAKSIGNSESKYSSSSSSSSSPSPRLPMRSLSASTGTSAYTARTTAKSTGALDRAMETLFEEGTLSPTGSNAQSPTALPLALAAEGQRDSVSKPPKLPMRSHTSPTMSTGRLDARQSKRPKIKVCVKCDKTIDDGRWIQMDGGSVLCDKCWKTMYLPKCRRCNLTIEKQAVSSSDGQLKGKYHRDCFNCHTCQKPFPDKTFYVFDGKPFCAYHYHEANNSLCAAATCGQPIEGPCAVSHAGDRYHPEHLVCEHPRCAERLLEYYEVDGRMFCERHAQMAEQGDIGDDEDGPQEIGTSRAMKRVTRFIDLVGGSELR